MNNWDPYRRRRLIEEQRLRQEAARRAEQERLRRLQQEQQAQNATVQVSAAALRRFEEELVKAQRERDEWADRFHALEAQHESQLREIEAQRAAVQAEVEAARAELEQEREAHRTQLRAEADSQRERLSRNAEQRAFSEVKSTLTRLLDVVDNLDRVVAQSEAEAGAVIAGVKLTRHDFLRALEQIGVARLESLGQPFDPAQHEAVAQVPNDAPSGTILQEVGAGYTYRGALLRPARVIVSA